MANIINDYPKSSCDCYNCTKNCYEENRGYPTNMSVRGCNFPKYYECYDKVPFRYDIGPKEKSGYQYLNSDVLTDKYSPDFVPVNCPNNKTCNNPVYASSDPRLISAAHNGQVLTLDRPPINSAMKLSEIPVNKSLDNYGKSYRTYSDINAGQIMYYIDDTFKDPFIKPLYATSAKTYGTMYKDPMGSMKPQYDREPITCNDPLDTHNSIYEGELSWIQDSTSFREDIMSKQMRKSNQQRYEPRWYK